MKRFVLLVFVTAVFAQAPGAIAETIFIQYAITGGTAFDGTESFPGGEGLITGGRLGLVYDSDSSLPFSPTGTIRTLTLVVNGSPVTFPNMIPLRGTLQLIFTGSIPTGAVGWGFYGTTGTFITGGPPNYDPVLASGYRLGFYDAGEVMGHLDHPFLSPSGLEIRWSAEFSSGRVPPACGDGTLDSPDEECDDGNNTDGDGCSALCTIESFCGDGNADPGEECDDGGESVVCDADCTFAICGDGTLNSTTGEQCDDGNNVGGDLCTPTCQPQAGGAVEVCHGGRQTVIVSSKAEEAHLDHGDTPGPCP